MNARDKLNTWNIVAAVVVGLFIAGLFSSGWLFWIVVAAIVWWSIKHGTIR